MEQIDIRPATPDDAAALLAIYAPYVAETAISFEYDVPSEEEFRQRIIGFSKEYPYLVAEEDGRIVGYAYAHIFHGRAAYQWSVETSIYVDRHEKRKGIGKVLHEALEQALKAQGILNMEAAIAYIEEEDEYLTHDSIRFHEWMGYKKVAHFHQCGRKFGRWYDVVWMEKIIGDHL
jgi:phosphinothricin acetyltransferase